MTKKTTSTKTKNTKSASTEKANTMKTKTTKSTNASVKSEVKKALASKGGVKAAKAILRKHNMKIADFRDSFKLTKAGVLPKNAQWAQPLFGKSSKTKAERKKAVEFDTTELTGTTLAIAKKMYSIFQEMTGYQWSNAETTAKEFVKANPDAKLKDFGVHMFVHIVNNKTDRVNRWFYKAPMKNSNYVDAYNWAVDNLIDKVIEKTPVKHIKLLADEETMAQDAFSIRIQPMVFVIDEFSDFWAE